MENKILYQVVDANGEEVCICTSKGMAEEFAEAFNGKYFPIKG